MTDRIVGTILHGGRSWKIDAEPDVMIRLKRILPGVRYTAESLVVSDTPEMARELEWILTRWTFDISADAHTHLVAQADSHRERERLVAGVMAGTAHLPRGGDWVTPALPLRDYQQLATDLVRATGSALIVDELGLGKTLISLALLEDPAQRPAMAVTLTGLGDQWLRELRKFYPQLTGVELKSTDGPRELRRAAGADLIVTNYAKVAGLAPHFKDIVKTVIFDEIQELRRSDSMKYQGAELLSHGAMVAGLSATPVYNFGGEMYSIMNIIQPGCLGMREEFMREWARFGAQENGKVRLNDPAGLRAHLMSRGLFLRRTREEVGIELPAIETVEQFVPSDSSVLDKMSGNAVEMARLVLSENATRTERWQSAGELDWRMRQATGISKAPFVGDFVRLILESQEKVLLFGWHRAVYDLWMERLKDFKPVLYTGSESPKQKLESFRSFTEGDARVLVLSLRSGAGLDGLQDVCSTLVFGELDWSPGVHRQAIGRLGRPGQKNGVLAYFCVTNDGSDPVILDTLNIKAMESDQLIEPDNRTNGTATPTTSTEHIKKLAELVLARHQEEVPA